MFGAEEHDWVAPYESTIPRVYSTTDYYDAHYIGTPGQRPRATKGTKGVRSAKGVKGTKGVKGASQIYQKGVRERQQAAAYASDPRYAYASGYGAFYGYGDADVPYTNTHGASATAHLTQQSQCGDAFGVQQALTDLGYPVAVDGIIGPLTFSALDAFAAANGVAYTHGSYPSGTLCQTLEDQWNQQHGAPPPGGDQPNVPVPPNPNSGIVDSTKTWWSNLPTATKYLVAGTGAVAAAVFVAALVKTPKVGHGRA
jgi:hypothetical protein